jgi:hypothetical protein
VIVFNFTGLSRWYLVPRVGHESDGDGLWYVDLKWLGVEVSIYSRQMGNVLIRVFAAAVKASSLDHPLQPR